MDLNAIKLFLAVAQTGSFLHGSRKCQTPIATVSRKIRELEQALNTTLFERSKRGVTLTTSGRQLFEQASLGMELLEEITTQIKCDQVHFKGKLRLSIPQAFTLWWKLLEDFQTQYPDIVVNVVSSNQKMDLIAEGIDVAVRLGDLKTDLFVARKVMDLQIKLVASPDYLAQYGTPQEVESLSQHRLGSWSANSEQAPLWYGHFANLTLTPHFSTNDYLQLQQWLCAGHGIGELPNMLADPLIKQGILQPILTQHPFPIIPVHLVYPKHRQPNSLVRAYLAFCEQWLERVENMN